MTTMNAEAVWRVLGSILDPEFGVSIVDLGLIYDVTVADADVRVAMTLTSPSCPAGEMIHGGVESALAGLPGIGRVQVDLVWEPRWTPAMLTAEAKAQLG